MNMELELKNYLEYCKYRKELNANTLKAYRLDLEKYVRFMKKENLEKKKIEQYITELHKSYKQKTVKRKIASIKAFYKFLEEEEILGTVNPFDKIKVRFKEAETLPRIITRKNIEILLSYMYHQLNNSESYYERKMACSALAAVEILFATGIRVYELSNIKMEDIDLSTGIIKIKGKGNRERYVQIGNEEVLQILRLYNKEYRTPKYIYCKNVRSKKTGGKKVAIIENEMSLEANLFNNKNIYAEDSFLLNKNGRRFSEQSVRNIISRYTKEAGIAEAITPHMFRHSAATYLLEEGVDIMYIMKLLGHSSIKTTQIYLHIASEKQMEVLKEKHPRNKMKILGRLY